MMNRIWEEVIHAARQAPRMYFAPFVGAVHEVVRVSREIEQENRERDAGRRREGMAGMDGADVKSGGPADPANLVDSETKRSTDGEQQ